MLEKIVRKISSISPSLLCCCIVLHLALERTTAVVVLLSTFPNFSYPKGIRPALALLPWGWVSPLIHPLLSAVTACNALLFFDFGSGLVSKSPPPPTSTICPSLSAPSPPNNPVLPAPPPPSQPAKAVAGRVRGTAGGTTSPTNASKSAPLQAPAKRSATQHDFDE